LIFQCTFIYTCNISKLWKLLIDEQANINQRELQTFTKWGARFFLVFLFLFFFTRSLVVCVCFVDRCLSFCSCSFGHCVVCSASIYGFWLPLWYLNRIFPISPFSFFYKQILIRGSCRHLQNGVPGFFWFFCFCFFF
jgi:hypothetical protein